MNNLIERAKEFALEAHKGQMHGSVPIRVHLEAVSAKAEKEAAKYYNNAYLEDKVDRVIAAAWLHDVIEDTDKTAFDILEEFGIEIAYIVHAVTDGKGSNRLERHLNTYYRTRQNSDAIFIKLCDRWHNQKRSTEKAERFMEMYHREYLYFKFALYEPGMFDDFWAELDEQYKTMDEIIKAR